ncbi:hypothetical protein [Streptomyces chartreusis]
MNGNDAPGQQWGRPEQPPQRGPQPPPASRKSRSVRSVLTHTLAVVLGLVVGAVIGSSAADNSDSKGTTPSATATDTETPTTTAPEEETPTPSETKTPEDSVNEIPGDGTYVVGKDIKPGTYRTEGPADTAIPNCYWARLRGTSGEFNEIIANGNTAGPTTVTISANDKAFQTTGCKTWKMTG